MNHTTKGIPGFQFKIRFNSTFNCWEVWTYRAGETDPRTAKWMKVSKETAHWYQEAKGAIVESYVPEKETSPFVGDSDILLSEITEAVTTKGTDCPVTKHAQMVVTNLVASYQMASTDSSMEKYCINRIKKYLKIIKDRRAEIDPITDWSNQMNSFDDSNIQEL